MELSPDSVRRENEAMALATQAEAEAEGMKEASEKDDEEKEEEEKPEEIAGPKPKAEAKAKQTAGKAKAKAKAKSSALKRPAASKASPSKKKKTGDEGKKELGEEKEPGEEKVPEEGEEEKKDPKKEVKKSNKEKSKGDKKEGKDKKEKEKKDKPEQEKKEKKKVGAAADKEKAQALLQISGDEADEEKKGDEEMEEDENHKQLTRDKKKSWFFSKHFEQLPEAVKTLFQSKEVSRKEKTEIVNSVVQRDDRGNWKLQPDNPTVTALQGIFKKVTGGERFVYMVRTFFTELFYAVSGPFGFALLFSDHFSVSVISSQLRHARGIPKALMLAKLGGEIQLAQALQSGDIVKVTQTLGFFLSSFFPDLIQKIKSHLEVKKLKPNWNLGKAKNTTLGARSPWRRKLEPMKRFRWSVPRRSWRRKMMWIKWKVCFQTSTRCLAKNMLLLLGRQVRMSQAGIFSTLFFSASFFPVFSVLFSFFSSLKKLIDRHACAGIFSTVWCSEAAACSNSFGNEFADLGIGWIGWYAAAEQSSCFEGSRSFGMAWQCQRKLLLVR